MKPSAIDRIFERLVIARGGTVEPEGALRYRVTIPDEVELAGAEAEEAPSFTFRDTLTVSGSKVNQIDCDAPVDTFAPVRAATLGRFQTDLAVALHRETVAFSSFADVERFLVTELGAEAHGDFIEIAPEDAEPVFVSSVHVAREPWVSFSTPFVDGVDPEWLLEKTGELTHLHFESFEGDVSLACAFPLAHLTGQRLFELVEDLVFFRETMLAEIEGDEGEGDDHEG
jgi:hypothetical protein